MVINLSKFTIKQILADHWNFFVSLGYKIRPCVVKNVHKVINCGDPSLGHAIFHCDKCDSFKYIPFRCKSRFCNTCGANYVNERATNISFKLVNCKHRHLVFTIAKELRIFFLANRKLLNLLFKATRDTLMHWFTKINKSENFIPGFISTLHTFGRDLQWNPHIHLIITEGACGNRTTWRKITHFPYKMLRKRYQATLLHLLHKALGSSFYHLKTKLFKTYTNGFYVYAKSDNKITKKSIDYIVRYAGKPAMAQSRILNYNGKYVTFYYDRHQDNKRITETIDAISFIKRLLPHIHDEQFKTVRYYGIYAKKHKQSSKLILLLTPTKRKYLKSLSNFRMRYFTSFGVDPLRCTCGNSMKLVDFFIPKHSPIAYHPPPSYNYS